MAQSPTFNLRLGTATGNWRLEVCVTAFDVLGTAHGPDGRNVEVTGSLRGLLAVHDHDRTPLWVDVQRRVSEVSARIGIADPFRPPPFLIILSLHFAGCSLEAVFYPLGVLANHVGLGTTAVSLSGHGRLREWALRPIECAFGELRPPVPGGPPAPALRAAWSWLVFQDVETARRCVDEAVAVLARHPPAGLDDAHRTLVDSVAVRLTIEEEPDASDAAERLRAVLNLEPTKPELGPGDDGGPPTPADTANA